jgi:signal transduction histidine kinase
VALSLGMLIVSLVGTAGAAHNNGMPAPPLAYVLAAIAALGLLLWRVRPLWNISISGSATMLYLLLGYTYGPILFALAISALGAALWLPLRRALAATGTVLAAALAVAAIETVTRGGSWSQFGLTAVLAIPAWLIIPAAIGVAIRARREATTQVRSAQARRAVSEERLRLAQEVHDVAGHGFAVIAMQAGVALRVLDRDPAAARAALAGIRSASRDALADLRVEVEALRTGVGRPEGEGAPSRPRSGIADLPALVARMRDAGLPVTLDGAPSTVEAPPDVEFVAYRIVQEALTNVLRHAGPRASAWVTVGVADDHLQITVRDDGSGLRDSTNALGSGHGVGGMRDRAASVGGTLIAGPVDSGGFLVTATLPLSTEDGPE